MKKLSILPLTIAAVALAQAAAMPLEKARAQIDKAIASPKVMQQVTAQLSPADQIKFLGEVNQAISKMPGSAEERAVSFLSVNRAAFRGAAKGNLAKMVAETFATVTADALPLLNEQFAKQVFNRAADPKHTYTDAEFIKIAETTMKVVNERLQGVDGAEVRAGFATLMFIRASNSQSEEVKDALLATLPEGVREKAKNEWYPSALAEGESQSYDAMLLTSENDYTVTKSGMQALFVPGPQLGECLLADLTGGNTEMSLTAASMNPMVDASYSTINRDMPTGMDSHTDAGNIVTPKPDDKKLEPGPYQYQSTGGSW